MTNHELNRRFPHKFCINLDSRPDRWQRMQARFDRHGIEGVNRFAAFVGADLTPPPGWEKTETKGQYGCLMSHNTIVTRAKADGLPHVLIFEDDVDFDPDFAAKFNAFIDEVPDDWDLLLFGGIHQQEPIRVSDHVYRLTGTNSTHAYVLRSNIYQAFLDLNEKQPEAVDIQATFLQQRFKCYCFIPHLAWVAPDYSDTRRRKVNAGWLKESLVLVGEEMRAAMAATTFYIFCDGELDAPSRRRGIDFIFDFYGRQFPTSRFVLIERGPDTSFEKLPANFVRFLLPASHPLDCNMAFAAALERHPPGDTAVFADGDVYLAHRDIRANVLMAARYDFVSGRDAVYELTREDCERVLHDGGRIDFPSYTPAETPLGTGFCVVNRAALARLGGWPDGGFDDGTLGRLTVFHSPNPAMRLFAREQAPCKR